MYPRLSSNQATKVRDEIAASQEAKVSLADLMKSDLKNLLDLVEQGESSVETTIEQLYLQAEAILQSMIVCCSLPFFGTRLKKCRWLYTFQLSPRMTDMSS